MENFDIWNNQKKKINKTDTNIFFKEREIWWVGLGLNVGYEQDGKGSEFERPVLVIKKFNRFIALVVPLTTVKKDNQYYVQCVLNEDIKFRMAIISQLRLLDAKRFFEKIGMANEESFLLIKKAIRNMF